MAKNTNIIDTIKGRHGFYLAIFVSLLGVEAINLASVIATFFGELNEGVIVVNIVKAIVFIVIAVYACNVFVFLTLKIHLLTDGIAVNMIGKKKTVLFKDIKKSEIKEYPNGSKSIILSTDKTGDIEINRKTLEPGGFKRLRNHLRKNEETTS